LKVVRDRLEKSESRQWRQTGETLIVAERFTELPNGQFSAMVFANSFMPESESNPQPKRRFFPGVSLGVVKFFTSGFSQTIQLLHPTMLILSPRPSH